MDTIFTQGHLKMFQVASFFKQNRKQSCSYLARGGLEDAQKCRKSRIDNEGMKSICITIQDRFQYIMKTHHSTSLTSVSPETSRKWRPYNPHMLSIPSAQWVLMIAVLFISRTKVKKSLRSQSAFVPETSFGSVLGSCFLLHLLIYDRNFWQVHFLDAETIHI